MSHSALTRRKFLAAGSTALLASQMSAPSSAQAASPAKLAIEGGAKAVTSKAGPWVRWGAPEREQLDQVVQQPSVFYWRGPKTQLFVERFQQHYPLKHVMTCGSGTAALHIAVAAAGIGPGDEVITTPITDMGTVIGILFQQGVPVFVDLEPNTANLSVAAVERAITPRTKAIIAVHLTGQPCDLQGLKALADKHNLVLIEDCAQAWGAKYRGQPVGTVGHLACFSLMNSKHIGVGDGGVVASSDERFGPRLQMFGDKGFNRHDSSFRFDHTAVLATNYRLSEITAAFGAAQLNRLEGIAEKRARLGRILTEEIKDLPALIVPPVSAEHRATVWFYLFRIVPSRLKVSRADFAKALVAEGVPAGAGYIPAPIYKMPLFQQHAFFAGRWPIKELGLTQMDYRQTRCPEAEAILETCLQVRINESQEEGFVREVGAAIRKVTQHYTV